MKSKRLVSVLLLVLVCLLPLQGLCDSNALYQVSTLQALMEGDYYGALTLDELLKHGDTGLGTFDGLDGEMIILDGVVYQASYNGSINVMDGEETTPFANVAYIGDGEAVNYIFEGGYDELLAALTECVPDENMPVVFVITGTFTEVSVRSVPAQEEPYPTLAEVVEDQSVFTIEEVEGTIVGFRFPSYMGDINTTGYHLHFISSDHTFGGHLLGIESGVIAIQYSELTEFTMILPQSIKDYNLSATTDEEIEAVESN